MDDLVSLVVVLVVNGFVVVLSVLVMDGIVVVLSVLVVFRLMVNWIVVDLTVLSILVDGLALVVDSLVHFGHVMVRYKLLVVD